MRRKGLQRKGLHGRPRRKKVRWRWLVRGAVVALVLVALVLLWVTRPARLGRIVAWGVARGTGAEVTVERAELALNGTVTLRGVDARVPDVAGEAGRLFACPEVIVGLTPGRGLGGGAWVSSATLIGPEFWVVEDVDAGGFVAQRLGVPEPEAHEERGGAEPGLPEVFVRRAVVHRGELRSGRYAALGEMGLSGSLTATMDSADVYRFAMTAQSDRDRALALSGVYDREARTLDAVLRDLVYDDTVRSLLPEALRRFDALHRPEGTASVELSVTPLGYAASLRLHDAAIDLPYGETTNRMTDVDAEFAVRDDGIELRGVTGEVAGVRYTLRGTYEGLTPDAPFALSVATQPFDLPSDINEVFALPNEPTVRWVYRQFQPAGEFTFDGSLVRDIAGGAVLFRGTVEAIDASMTYEHFPYPLEHVTGRVRFSNDAVLIESMRGYGPGGNALSAEGRISPPGPTAEIVLDLRSDALPIDDALVAATPEWQRGVYGFFRSEAALAGLYDAGLVHDPASDAGVPAFGFAGDAARVHVSIRRPLGEDTRLTNVTRVDAAGLGLLLESWPYPLRGRSGTVVVDGSMVRVDRVVADGPTGARATVNGWTLARATTGSAILDHALAREVNTPWRHAALSTGDGAQDGRVLIMLRVTDAEMPVDALLLHSVPGDQAAWLDELRLSGVLAGGGGLMPGGDGGFGFRFDAALTDGGLRPFRSETPIRGVTASMLIAHDRLRADGLAGHWGDGALTGRVAVDYGREAGLDLALRGEGVPLNRTLTAALPADLPGLDAFEAWLDDHAIDGAGDVAAEYTGRFGEAAERLAVTVRPTRLSGVINGTPLATRSLTGEIDYDGRSVALSGIEAAIPGGTLRVNGLLDPAGIDGAGGDLALDLSAELTQRTDATDALLPPAVARLIDTLDYAGGLTLADARLSRTDGNTRFAGQVTLRDASANAGVELSELEAELGVTVDAPADAGVVYAVEVRNASAVALERRLESFELDITNRADAPDDVRLTGGRGRLYGGTLLLNGSLRTGDAPWYAVDVAINHAEAPAMLDPNGTGADTDAPHVRSRDAGLVNARLAITGPLSDPAARDGRGAFAIRNANLYQRPLTLTLLSAANFAAPTHSSFKDAHGEFFIRGDTLFLDHLSFDAPQVRMTGQGTVSLADQALDLTMYTQNPNLLDLGGLSAITRAIQNELLRIRVTGTLAEPEAAVAPFQSIFGAIGELIGFGRDRARR